MGKFDGNSLKKVKIVELLALSGIVIFSLPFLFASALWLFSGICLSARGANVGLMSSMGSKVTGHASPSATFFASEGSMYLQETIGQLVMDT